MQEELKTKITSKQILLICFIILILLLTLVIGILVVRIKKLQEPTTILPDTTIVNPHLNELSDSIKQKEKEIDKYKIEYIYEKEEAHFLTDSAAVQLFIELASE